MTNKNVSLDRRSTTVTNVVEGCVYIRKRFYAISLMRGEFQHSALRSFSPLCPQFQRRKETSPGREAVRASRLGLYEHTIGLKVEVLVPGAKDVCTGERLLGQDLEAEE